MNIINYLEVKMRSIPSNEAFARHIIGEFVLELNPTIEELEDIKTSVSEAVTNSIVHGYNNEIDGEITLKCSLYPHKVEIIVVDNGIGIENIDKAIEPFYTTKPNDERSGMGFTLMKSFMSDVEVKSEIGKGTIVIMTKNLAWEEDNVRAE